MNPDFISFANPALSALVNGSAQGLVLAGVVGIGMRLFPRANAATRHTIGMTSLLIVAALPLAHLCSALNQVLSAAPAPAEAAAPAPPPPAALEAAVVWIDPDLAGATILSEPQAQTVARSPATAPGWLERVRDVRWLGAEWESSLPAWLSLGLVGIWLAGAGWKLARLAVNYRALSRLKARAVAPPEDLAARFERMRAGMGLCREARLRLSPALAGPIAAGFFQPAVLLPSSFAECMRDERFEQVARHELAHLGRWDDWTNLLQQIIRALFFFHPGVWWLSRRVDNDREVACDDHVLAMTAHRESYALLLLTCQGGDRSSALAPAAWHRKTQIEERINMILNKSRDISTRTAPFKAGALTLSALLLAVGAFQFAPRVALAQDTAPASAQEPPIEKRGEEDLTDLPKRIEERRTIVVESEWPKAGSGRSISRSAVRERSEDGHAEITIRGGTAREEGVEDRLARLERMVESLLARSDRPHHSSNTVEGAPLLSQAAPKPPKPPRSRTAVRVHASSAADTGKFGLELARHELAVQKERLQAELEHVREELARIEVELERIQRETSDRSPRPDEGPSKR